MATTITKADRIAGAIVGSLLADAAVAPLHWIYDTAKLEATIKEGDGVAFHEPFSCPFYSAPFYTVGSKTPYGDEVVPLLMSLDEKKGFDKADFTEKFAKFVREYEGRLNHATKDFLANVDAGKAETGADNWDAMNVYKAVAIGAMYSGKSAAELAETAEAAIRVHQNHQSAVDSGLVCASMIAAVVEGASVPDALAAALSADSTPFVFKLRLKPVVTSPAALGHTELVHAIGPTCAQPGSFVGAIHAAAAGGDFKTAVEKTIAAGGDQAGRAAVVGGLYGAANGLTGLPEDWVAKAGPWLAEVTTIAKSIAEAATTTA